ncbi:PqqD family protein of HPr-rel-A system [Constrictibacter sp. MBR-5]|uniref:PqqD family protein n=1 Tax=Constrictibacter sp. MBR-5 TaxID=3156467 RepID=UPI003394DE72
MASVAPDETLRRNDGMIGAPVEGGYVVLDVEAGKYLHLNATALRVWEMLEEPMTFAALCAALQERFDVEPDRCAKEVGALAERMLAAGLIRKGG